MCSRCTSENMEHEDAYHTSIDQRIIETNEMLMPLIDGLYEILSGYMNVQHSNPGVSSLKFTVIIFIESSSMCLNIASIDLPH